MTGDFLTSKIESLLKGVSLNTLSKEREKLTKIYRGNDCRDQVTSLSTDYQRLAYISTRLPATYAAIYQVLMELIKRCGGAQISSLLDVGAGPGTVLLAAIKASLPITSATLLERDPGFIEIGRRLTEDLPEISSEWICKDVTQGWTTAPHDLVVASYALNELKEQDRLLLVEKLWGLTNKFLVIIEPGTKAAFESLMKIRQNLIFNGAHLIAPCPHSKACPLGIKDWCHFSARLERSSLHRKTKGATLNYEDEKFSYLIFSKTPFEPCQSRILRRPFKGEGFVKIPLCSSSTLELKTITRKNKVKYLYAKKLDCGDSYTD